MNSQKQPPKISDIQDNFDEYWADYLLENTMMSNFLKAVMNPLKSKISRRKRYTPDFVKLKMFEHVLVFVCDDFMTGGKWHSVVSHSHYLGQGITLEDKYVLRTAGKRPFLYDGQTGSMHTRGRVEGEVYAVTPEVLGLMDEIVTNGYQFKRKLKNIALTDQLGAFRHPNTRVTQQCWTYCTDPEVHNPDNKLLGDYRTLTVQKAGTNATVRRYFFKPEDTSSPGGFHTWLSQVERAAEERCEADLDRQMFEEYDSYGYGAHRFIH